MTVEIWSEYGGRDGYLQPLKTVELLFIPRVGEWILLSEVLPATKVVDVAYHLEVSEPYVKIFVDWRFAQSYMRIMDNRE